MLSGDALTARRHLRLFGICDARWTAAYPFPAAPKPLRLCRWFLFFYLFAFSLLTHKSSVISCATHAALTPWYPQLCTAAS